jgi:hypothetical protein
VPMLDMRCCNASLKNRCGNPRVCVDNVPLCPHNAFAAGSQHALLTIHEQPSLLAHFAACLCVVETGHNRPIRLV